MGESRGQASPLRGSKNFVSRGACRLTDTGGLGDYHKLVADAVCNGLEANSIRCWIAPRDVLPGRPYGEALIEALNKSRILLLIFSGHSNLSPQVLREVERAASKGLSILPFRIEGASLSPAMEYFISSPHWLDALTPPIEQHISELTRVVTLLLSPPSDGQGGRPTDALATRTPQASIAPGVVVVDASEIESVHYGHWAELTFSLSNQSPDVQKITGLFLQVEERIEIDSIRLKKAGAILKEFQLSAEIGDEILVNLLENTGIQILLNQRETEAFRLKIEAQEGFRYRCTIVADFMNIQTGEKRELSSKLVQIDFPIRDIRTLLSRREKK